MLVINYIIYLLPYILINKIKLIMADFCKYDDPTQYTLISERQTYENGFNIQVQILKELETNNEIKRTLKIPNPDLTSNQINNIQERSKWNRFGLTSTQLNYLTSNKFTNVVADTFIEYNLDYLKGDHNKNVIKKMLKDPYNVDKIKIRDDRLDTNNDFEKYVYDIYRDLETETDDMMTYKNFKYITSDYENVRDDIILKPKKKKSNKTAYRPQARTSGAFVPRFRRDSQSSNTNNNNINSGGDSNKFVPRHRRDRDNGSNMSDREEFTVRISNLPDEPEYEDVINWLKNLDIGRFKLILPKNRRTGKNNNYGFIKYYSKDYADACIEKVHRQSYEYNIINAEYARPRN